MALPFQRKERMMLREYLWRGYTWQIDEKDLHLYPGAVLLKSEPKTKKKPQASNKSRRAPKDK